MTDTIPATATGLPTPRRAFLRQLASVTIVGGAVPLAALPATVSLASSPALAGETEVEIAYREFCRLDDIERDLWLAAFDIEEANPDPERPKCLPFNAMFCPPGPDHQPRAILVSDEGIALLRRVIANRLPPRLDPSGIFARNNARAQIELDLALAWRAERARRRAACGLPAAWARVAAARKALDAQRAVLFAASVRTTRDLALKARAIRDHEWDDGAVEGILDKLIEMAGHDDRDLA